MVTPPSQSSASRVPVDVTDLRSHTARGTTINSLFQVGMAGLGLVRSVAVAAFLTQEEFGVWGILMATLITLLWLKQVGIADKFIQQNEPDQELAFQKAFTIELILSAAYFVLCLLVLPVFALAYDRTEIIVPGLVLSTAVLLTALQTPTWIPYRQLQYTRQRVLTAIDPVVSTTATIALTIAGFGLWGLIAGALIGSAIGAAVCVATSPYRLRIRFDRATVREYTSFSWPLMALGFTNLVTVQGSLLVTNYAVGINGIAAIGLATGIAAFTDRVDGIVSQTLYPAVCAVADRMRELREVFVKSNRVALMWAMPFAVGLALFARDLVELFLGDKWLGAVELLQIMGLALGLGQVAFNWTIFMRAANRTRPLLVAAWVHLIGFVLVTAPATILWNLRGYAAGIMVQTVAQLAVRGHYLGSLFGHVSILRQTLRGVAPTVLPAALVLGERAIAGGGHSAARFAGEVVLYSVATVVSTAVLERRLLREILGYLRRRGVAPRSSAPGSA